MHISIEGFDGVGKTTAARALAEKLGFELVEKPLKDIFDPDGGTANYIRIRNYVNFISPNNRPFSAFFYGLGNIFLYEKYKGKNIITDRHILSNYGWSGSPESQPVFEVLFDILKSPEFTFIIYGNVDTIRSRLKNRDKNDSDLRKLSSVDEVYRRMIDFAEDHNMPHLVIDTADKTADNVLQIMLGELRKRGLIDE